MAARVFSSRAAVLGFCLAFAPSTGHAAAAGPSDKSAAPATETPASDDVDAATQVREALSAFDEFHEVRVEMKQGMVVLTGFVPNRDARDALAPMVRSVASVRHVWNRTSVAAEGEGASSKDAATEDRLNAVFANVEVLEGVRATVRGGVVKLSGRSASPSAAKKAEEIAQKLPNSVYVENGIEVASDVPDRVKPTVARLEDRYKEWTRELPLILLAGVIVILFWLAARLVRRLEFPFRLFHGRLAKDIARRLFGTAMVGVGLVVALELLDATALVGAVFGAAGVVGVVLGFAFRDIVENYLASILLSVRRPFASNDHVVIGDHEGKVVRLTSRDTILMTLQGNHLRLPNAAVFKSEILNYTRNPMRRFDFNLGLGVEEDIAQSMRLGIETLSKTPGIADTPPPFARVEALADSNVGLKFFGWVDQQENDWYKVKSEAIRRVKVAFDTAGIDMPVPTFRVGLQRRKPDEPKAPIVKAVDESAHEVGVDDYLEDQMAADRAQSTEETDLLAPEV